MTSCTRRSTRYVFACVFTIVYYSIQLSRPNKDSRTRHDYTAQQEDLSLGVIKTKVGYGIGSWQLVDWQYPVTAKEDTIFNSEMTAFKSVASGKESQICVHDFAESISTHIKRDKKWMNCNILPKLWNDGVHNNTGESQVSCYVKIGANIGACIIEMLLGTDASIIA